MAERYDVVVVGAGLSGVGAGYRLQTECPGKSYVILEGRSQMGGTWDLFRYPGIRSDSDMFTLGFPFRPWKDPKAIADGPSILSYIKETAEVYGIDRHIRYDTKVVSASWSSERATWMVKTGAGVEYEASFLYLCSGYYRYESGYEPEFEGRERFSGTIVHPQHWPEDLDYAGKRVVVVGSGATAVTLVPAMASTAVHVTMLQRSPTYIVSVPGEDRIANALRARLPEQLAHHLVRWKNVAMTTAMYQFSQRRPEAMKKVIAKGVHKQLPGYPIEPDFAPTYNPWDQRMCLVPDGDLFEAMRNGSASIETGTIKTFTEKGIELESGKVLEADIIITATGLDLVALGGIELDVDGERVDPADSVSFRGFMLSGLPNLAMAIGYTNASWTLRADLSTRAVCNVLNRLDETGTTTVVPTPSPDVTVTSVPLLDLTSNYVKRAADRMPKQGSASPWRTRHNYIIDFLDAKYGKPFQGLVFSRHRGSRAVTGATPAGHESESGLEPELVDQYQP